MSDAGSMKKWKKKGVSERVSEGVSVGPSQRTVTMNVNVALHWFTAVLHFTGSEHAYR